MRKVVLASVKYCSGCGEKTIQDRKHDFRNADISDEMYHYNECRLCGHKREIKPRMGAKKKQRNLKQKELNDLVQELLSK